MPSSLLLLASSDRRSSSSSPPLLAAGGGLLLPAAAVSIAAAAAAVAVHSRRSRREQLGEGGGCSGDRKMFASPPGRLPLLGHVHLIPANEFAATLEGWADELLGGGGRGDGAYEIDLAGSRHVVVCDGELALEVLKHRPYVAQRLPALSEAFDSVGAGGVLTAEGETWKREHRLVASALNRKSVRDYLAAFNVTAKRLVAKWSAACDDRDGGGEGGGSGGSAATTVLVADDLSNVAADSIAKVSLDKDYDFLNHPGGGRMGRDVRVALGAINDRFVSPVRYWRIPLIGQYLDGRGWSIRRISRAIGAVIGEHEAERRASENRDVGEATKDGKRKRTFLEKVFDVMDDEKSWLGRERLTGNVTTLFMAGTDTTSRTLTNALYLLGSESDDLLDLQDELRAEADRVDLDEDVPDLNSMYAKLPRIKSFFHEVHRFYGLPISTMHLTEDIPFMGGKTTLKKGTDVTVLSRYISTSAACPPKDVPAGPSNRPASEFCPRRWLVVSEEDGELSCPSPGNKSVAFMPFGYGVRTCPGRAYSEALSYTVLAMLLQNFTWTLAPNHPKPKYYHDVSVEMKDWDVKILLSKRSAASASS